MKEIFTKYLRGQVIHIYFCCCFKILKILQTEYHYFHCTAGKLDWITGRLTNFPKGTESINRKREIQIHAWPDCNLWSVHPSLKDPETMLCVLYKHPEHGASCWGSNGHQVWLSRVMIQLKSIFRFELSAQVFCFQCFCKSCTLLALCVESYLKVKCMPHRHWAAFSFSLESRRSAPTYWEQQCAPDATHLQGVFLSKFRKNVPQWGICLSPAPQNYISTGYHNACCHKL